MDDWQDTALNNRRIPHGRTGRGGRASGRKDVAVFDVRRTFGAYEIKCDAVNKLQSVADQMQTLEVHGLVDSEDGMEGSINLGGAIEGMILLAGNRKVLKRLVKEMETGGEDDRDDDEGDSETSSKGNHYNEPRERVSSTIEEADERENRRFRSFEKNSFRTPKFWFQWRGMVSQTGQAKKAATDIGYLVLNGYDCRSFKGTISCKQLSWDNVPVPGFKLVSKPRECPYNWTQFSVPS